MSARMSVAPRTRGAGNKVGASAVRSLARRAVAEFQDSRRRRQLAVEAMEHELRALRSLVEELRLDRHEKEPLLERLIFLHADLDDLKGAA